MPGVCDSQQITWVGKGVLYLTKGLQLDRAMQVRWRAEYIVKQRV